MARHLTNTELSVFFRETALLIRAGITPQQGIAELLEDAKEDPVLRALKERLDEGVPFHEALNDAGVFPSYVTGMVRIGEEAGALDEVLTSLADHYEREESLRDTIRGAVAYPLLMIVMMLIVVFVLITRVLPVFSLVFAQLGTDMNGLSGALLAAGQALNRSGAVLLVIFVLLIAGFLYCYMTQAGRRQAAAFLEHFGPTRGVRRDIAEGRFADALSLIFKSGIPLNEETIGMMQSVVGHVGLSKDIGHFYHLMEEESLSIPDALKSAGIFNGLYQSLMRAGFQAGEQDAVMERIAARYEEDTDRKLYAIVGKIEPTLVILLSAVVGIILLSVILPLIGVMSNLG